MVEIFIKKTWFVVLKTENSTGVELRTAQVFCVHKNTVCGFGVAIHQMNEKAKRVLK